VEVNRAWKHPQECRDEAAYSGGNVIFLWAHGYATQRWLTFKQALDVGGVVRKGEHGVKVYFVSKVEQTTDTDEVRHGTSATRTRKIS
jgi:antirestriction protein ArdC